MKFDVITSLKTPGAEIMAVDTNRLIVRLRDRRTQCVQLSDGALLWELEPDVPSPSAIIDGVALAMDHSNQLHAHDVHSGQQIWSQPIQQWRYWRYGPNLFVPSLAERELRIVGLHDGRVTQTLILPHERIFAVTEQVVIVSGMVER